jgi:hypothetical protein
MMNCFRQLTKVGYGKHQLDQARGISNFKGLGGLYMSAETFDALASKRLSSMGIMAQPIFPHELFKSKSSNFRIL